MKILQLDGSSGGGQMLRSALTLSLITRQPFRLRNLRGARQQPGLKRQHLTCIHAACTISESTVEGAEIGSTDITFHPGAITHGSHHFAIGTAGSTTLLLQTLLPALWNTPGNGSTITVEGGTHNPLAPPFEFIQKSYLPAVSQLGPKTSIELLESGFAPAGGGKILAHIPGNTSFQPFDFIDFQPSAPPRIHVITRNLPLSIAGRTLDSALSHLPAAEGHIECREPGPGQGLACLAEAPGSLWSNLATTFGETKVSAEAVGKRAAKSLSRFLDSSVPIGRHLADQLLLPLALAGRGSLLTVQPDDHVPTNIAVIQAFLPVRFEITHADRGQVLIRLS